jgi:hypothetical protein
LKYLSEYVQQLVDSGSKTLGRRTLVRINDLVKKVVEEQMQEQEPKPEPVQPTHPAQPRPMRPGQEPPDRPEPAPPPTEDPEVVKQAESKAAELEKESLGDA